MLNRRNFLQGFGASISLISTSIVKAKTHATNKRPNIILVMADDQGWGDVGYNGHPFLKTPNLDEMAKAGLRFDHFYAAAPVCSPTRASVLTGRHPIRSKVLDHGHYMRPQEETIAEALKRAGYKTGHFGKWHVGSVQKQSPVCPGNSGFDEWISAPNFFDLNPYLSDNGIAKRFEGESSALVIDWTLKFVKKHAHKENPFFAVAWFASPHSPHQSMTPDNKLYLNKKYKGYFQEINALDRAVGRLRCELRKEGIHDNTIVWYCSDNGGLLSESSGGRKRKGSIYEGGLRVPAIIEWPAKLKHAVVPFPAVTSDIYPTLLDITGLKPAHKHPLDGISLKPVLEGAMKVRSKGIGFWYRFAHGQSTYSDRIVKSIMIAQKAGEKIAIPSRLKKDIDEFPQYSTKKFPGHSAWLEYPWKLHRIENNKDGKVVYELYNLLKDSQEECNLITTQSKRQLAMKQNLNEWQISVINSLNGKDYKENSSSL